MGKKVCRKTYSSYGQRPNVSKDILKETAREVSGFQKALHIVNAWKKLKNPWVTISNPNKNETNKRFIKVRANSYYGDPKAKIKLGFEE